MRGAIVAIVGPMFAGKSSQLVRCAQILTGAQRVLCVNHSLDTRYEEGSICTHDQLRAPGISVSTVSDIIEYAYSHGPYDAILIDEGQFFADLAEKIEILASLGSGTHVYVSALSGNFLREPFAVVATLLTKVDYVYTRYAFCGCCRAPASFSARLTQDSAEIILGGADMYVPTCRTCWAAITHKRSELCGDIKAIPECTLAQLRATAVEEKHLHGRLCLVMENDAGLLSQLQQILEQLTHEDQTLIQDVFLLGSVSADEIDIADVLLVQRTKADGTELTEGQCAIIENSLIYPAEDIDTFIDRGLTVIACVPRAELTNPRTARLISRADVFLPDWWSVTKLDARRQLPVYPVPACACLERVVA
ncbi:Thymidine kinase [Giardia muris]|uniref:thymidine kinase n=1 Tax=Giardia muris TaxID=5742 RepID=A0A4Z1TBJ1_GIAMU|nr:Thymidine kinase [Giardia muris]|eukprot:TNJ30617.1 Thymidine kinase [Giardia muris]